MQSANPQGSCSCREVRFRLLSAPMFVHCCHCFDCQRHTGSAFAINALIETDRIQLVSGAPEPVSMPTESGRPHDIYRCPTCKVAVWSDYGRRPQLRFVRVATLDRPHGVEPDVHIFVRSKCRGFAFRTTPGRSKSITICRRNGPPRVLHAAEPSWATASDPEAARFSTHAALLFDRALRDSSQAHWLLCAKRPGDG